MLERSERRKKKRQDRDLRKEREMMIRERQRLKR